MGKLAVISESVVRSIVTRQLALDAVRVAFETVAENKSDIFDVVVGGGIRSGESFAIKSGTDRQNEIIGLKCGSYWASNNLAGLPAHGSTILLLDPETGFARVIISAAYLNGFRTAAANALAVSYLARPEASVLGVIGAGHQAEHEIRAVAEVRDLSLVRISTRSQVRAKWIIEQLHDLELNIQITSAEDAIRGADIITTVTPSITPLVRSDWVDDGAHISAMGADAIGKQELDIDLVRRAKCFSEFPPQSVKIGEFQHAHKVGAIGSADDICALGMVTLGIVSGRTSNSEITIFDSSGIAIQDLAVAEKIVVAARNNGMLEYAEF